MEISGSIYEDYQFLIEPKEIKFLNSRFINSVNSGFSSTFTCYKDIPDYMIKDAEYKPSETVTTISPKTISPRTKTEFLLIHDLCVDVNSGTIKPISEMKIFEYQKTSGKDGILYANFIPPVFAPYLDGFILAVNGEWNPALNEFTGMIEIGKLEGVKDALITS